MYVLLTVRERDLLYTWPLPTHLYITIQVVVSMNFYAACKTLQPTFDTIATIRRRIMNNNIFGQTVIAYI